MRIIFHYKVSLKWVSIRKNYSGWKIWHWIIWGIFSIETYRKLSSKTSPETFRKLLIYWLMAYWNGFRKNPFRQQPYNLSNHNDTILRDCSPTSQRPRMFFTCYLCSPTCFVANWWGAIKMQKLENSLVNRMIAEWFWRGGDVCTAIMVWFIMFMVSSDI